MLAVKLERLRSPIHAKADSTIYIRTPSRRATRPGVRFCHEHLAHQVAGQNLSEPSTRTTAKATRFYEIATMWLAGNKSALEMK
jgi:hypothetical protein